MQCNNAEVTELGVIMRRFHINKVTDEALTHRAWHVCLLCSHWHNSLCEDTSRRVWFVLCVLIVTVSDIIPVSAVNSSKNSYYRFRVVFQGKQSDRMYSTLIAAWYKADSSSAAQHRPAAVLENQLNTTKPQLALLQKKICCYQTSYMSHLEGRSYWGGDQKHLGLLFKRNEE